MTSGKICNPQGSLCGLGVLKMLGCTEEHLHIFNTGGTWTDRDKHLTASKSSPMRRNHTVPRRQPFASTGTRHEVNRTRRGKGRDSPQMSSRVPSLHMPPNAPWILSSSPPTSKHVGFASRLTCLFHSPCPSPSTGIPTCHGKMPEPPLTKEACCDLS